MHTIRHRTQATHVMALQVGGLGGGSQGMLTRMVTILVGAGMLDTTHRRPLASIIQLKRLPAISKGNFTFGKREAFSIDETRDGLLH